MTAFEVEVRGQKFDVRVSEGGQFCTEFEGDTLRYDTLAALKDKLMKATSPSRKNISIPFYMWETGHSWNHDEPGLRHGVITGIHGSNDNVLVKWDNGKGTEQVSEWRRSNKFLKFTDDEAAQYVARQKALRAALDAVNEFEEAHAFKARDAVKALMAKLDGGKP